MILIENRIFSKIKFGMSFSYGPLPFTSTVWMNNDILIIFNCAVQCTWIPLLEDLFLCIFYFFIFIFKIHFHLTYLVTIPIITKMADNTEFLLPCNVIIDICFNVRSSGCLTSWDVMGSTSPVLCLGEWGQRRCGGAHKMVCLWKWGWGKASGRDRDGFSFCPDSHK